MVNNHISYPASERSFFALLRKGIHRQALAANFSEQKINHIDLIVAEITSNLEKYATGGEVLCAVIGEGPAQYLEIISIDNGPGINDLSSVLLDGISSSTTLGYGLGSIKRLSDFFSIYSQVGWGTILVSRIYKSDIKRTIEPVLVSHLILAKPFETVSGDGCMYTNTELYFKLMVIDGLGHGTEANKVVIEANDFFQSYRLAGPDELIRAMHPVLKKTRGGVGTVVIYDKRNKLFKIVGVGNISTKAIDGNEVRNIMSYNGIIGHNIPNTMTEYVIQAKDFRYLILCSDGIKSRWDFTKHPTILRYDPIILAAAIYKDFGRQTDDMSVVILKVNQL
ncbi:ATP-binding SpoIIE family protein phosphatase [Pedobacter sp.]|uniref:ATP-binding SpoIIE family protein phosphatase n=1 Tax=Pedobacter sp. TaxID=1411316 RepID=UPI003D7F4DD2